MTNRFWKYCIFKLNVWSKAAAPLSKNNKCSWTFRDCVGKITRCLLCVNTCPVEQYPLQRCRGLWPWQPFTRLFHYAADVTFYDWDLLFTLGDMESLFIAVVVILVHCRELLLQYEMGRHINYLNIVHNALQSVPLA